MTLPPLSPDYSGVASVLHDLGALTAIHDASGCTGTYCGYDEPRWYGGNSPVFCSGLREMDAIMGRDEKLLAKLKAAQATAGAPFAAVIGSPVPMVVGFDFKGFARLAERELGIPVFGFPATGMGHYDRGQSDAYLALAERFLPNSRPDVRRGINLLGASALDGLDGPALDYLEELAESLDLPVLSVWGARSSFEDLCEAPCATVNWVLTAAALPLARLLRERYGTPYVGGLPVGRAEEDRIRRSLTAAALGSPAGEALPRPLPKDSVAPQILIVGEPLLNACLRSCLESLNRALPVSCASFFAGDPELESPGDLRFTCEDEAAAAFASADLAVLIGDPLLRGLLPASPVPRAIPLPHAALSGRLFRESRLRLFGAAGERLLLSAIGANHA